MTNNETSGAGPIAGRGASIGSIARMNERIVDLTIESPAMGRTAMVRLLLPARFDAEPDRRWPVLLLLHGAVEPESYRSWTHYTDLEAFTATTELLIVMPEGGWNGYYSDWWNGGAGGPPRWETFHIGEVLPIVERHFAGRGRRAIAGLSMGGLGAISYAERHPQLFVAAASFSGVLDSSQLTGPNAVNLDPNLWGDRDAQADIWRAHNPAAGADALRGKPVYISCGDGRPGPLDPPGTPFDELERLLNATNTAFLDNARAAGIDAVADIDHPGTHAWPYWQHHLHAAMPMLLEALTAGRQGL